VPTPSSLAVLLSAVIMPSKDVLKKWSRTIENVQRSPYRAYDNGAELDECIRDLVAEVKRLRLQLETSDGKGK
jgi:hypothetical protein